MKFSDNILAELVQQFKLEPEDAEIVKLVIAHRSHENKHQTLQDLEKAQLFLKKRINHVKINL
jgi:hypothetical protein